MSGYQMHIPRKAKTCAVYEEFSQLADMIWKFPRFLENEECIEREKLDDCFPEGKPQSTVLRAIRWNLEGEKLFVAFPRFLSKPVNFHAEPSRFFDRDVTHL